MANAIPLKILSGQTQQFGSTDTALVDSVAPRSGTTLGLGADAATTVINMNGVSVTTINVGNATTQVNIPGTLTVTTTGVFNGNIDLGDGGGGTINVGGGGTDIVNLKNNLTVGNNLVGIGSSTSDMLSQLWLAEVTGSAGNAAVNLRATGAGTAGAYAIGTQGGFTNFTPTDNSVGGALAGINTALGAPTTTLQQAYVNGNTISVSSGEGTIAFSNSTDAADVLSVSRSFAGGGIGIEVSMGATTTGDGLVVSTTAGAAGDALRILNSGNGNALHVKDGSNDALVVDGSGAVLVTGQAPSSFTTVNNGGGAGFDINITTGTGTGAGGGIIVTTGTATAAGGSGGPLSLTAGAGIAHTTGTGGSGGLWSFTGGVGGGVTTGTGGDGSGINFTLGNGGAASTSGTGGNGGSFIYTTGAGGNTATGNAGSAGNFSYNGNSGGNATGTGGFGGSGGGFSLSAGLGGTATDGGAGGGGAANLIAGNGGAASASGGTGGSGGDAALTAGDGGTATDASGGSGGNLNLNTGAGANVTTGFGGNGGSGNVFCGKGGNASGSGGSSGTGGSFSLFAGSGGSTVDVTPANGGTVTISAGGGGGASSADGGTGGLASFLGGSGGDTYANGQNGPGGGVLIQAGSAGFGATPKNGVAGDVTVKGGSTSLFNNGTSVAGNVNIIGGGANNAGSVIIYGGSSPLGSASAGATTIQTDRLNTDGYILKLTSDVSGTPIDTEQLNGSVDPSAGGGVAADTGSIYFRNNGGTSGEAWIKSGASNTAWSRITTFATQTLQQTYNNSSPPQISIGSTALDFFNSTNAVNILNMERTFAGGGNALTIAMGPGNQAVTGQALSVSSGTGATGTLVLIDNSGTGNAFHVKDAGVDAFSIDSSGITTVFNNPLKIQPTVVGSNPNQYGQVLEFSATGLQTVQTYVSEVSPEGVITAPPGSFAQVRYPSANANDGLWLKATGTGNTGWSQVATGTGSGSLQTAYVNGNAISVTTAEGTIDFSNSSDATNVLTISRSFAGGGNGITMTMATGTTGKAIVATGNSGSTGQLVQLTKLAGSSGTVLEVVTDQTADSAATFTTNTDNSSPTVDIEQQSATSTGDCLSVIQAGTGDAIVISSQGTTGKGIVATGQSGNSGQLVQLTKLAGSTGTVLEVVSNQTADSVATFTSNTDNSSPTVDIEQQSSTSTGDCLNVLQGGTGDAIVISVQGATGKGIRATGQSGNADSLAQFTKLAGSTGTVLEVVSQQSADSAATFTSNNDNSSPTVDIEQQSSTSTGDTLSIVQGGTGNGIVLNMSGTGGAAMFITQNSVSVSEFVGSANPSSGGGVAANTGSLFLRNNSPTGELWVKTGTANTAWSLVQTGAATTTLQQAYVNGNTISVTTGEGSISFSNTTDSTDVLALSRTFAGAGSALTVSMGATTTGDGVVFSTTAGAAGDALRILNSGNGNALHVKDGSTDVLVVTSTGAVNITPTTGADASITTTGASNINATTDVGGINIGSDVSTGTGGAVSLYTSSSGTGTAGDIYLTSDKSGGSTVGGVVLGTFSGPVSPPGAGNVNVSSIANISVLTTAGSGDITVSPGTGALNAYTDTATTTAGPATFGSITSNTGTSGDVYLGSFSKNGTGGNTYINAGSQTGTPGGITISSELGTQAVPNTGEVNIKGTATVTVDGVGITFKGGGTSALVVNSTGTAITVQAGATLATTSTGNINLPNNGSARFKVEGTSVGSTVTAPNLDTLTNGSNADALHTHSNVSASQVVQTGFDTSTNSVTSGLLGYLTTTANRVQKGIATSLTAALVFGANEGTSGSMTTHGTIDNQKIEPGITIAAGDRLFLSTLAAGGVTNVAPSTTGQVVAPVGFARTASSGAATGTGDSFAFSSPTVTLTDAGASFSPADTGKIINIAGATSSANNGYFVITYVSATQVSWTNASGVAEAYTGTWTLGGVADMLLLVGPPVVL